MTKTKRDMIIKWANRGYDTPTIANLLNLPENEVQAVLDHPEPEVKPRSASYGPVFIEPPSFNFDEE